MIPKRKRPSRKMIGPHQKPGPRPLELRIGLKEGRDYYCGTCAGWGEIPCEWCLDMGGCSACYEVGRVQCPECLGGVVPSPVPEWLPTRLIVETPHPPVSSRGDSGEKPVPGGERVGRQASRLTSDPIPES